MHFCVIKSRTIKIGFIMLLVLILLSLSINEATSAQVFFGYAPRKVPIYSVETTEKRVAISFDAAWGADKTEKILSICQEYDVKATFFLVGFWVDENPELVKKIDECGFEIGTHSNTHPDMTKLTAENQKLELQTSIDKIKSITNKEVNLFRAPYGAYNNSLIEQAEQLNLKTVQWDVDSLDWKGLSGEEITMRILNNVKDGSIILCHNNSEHILDALPMVLDRLKKKGFTITNIGNLIYQDNYTINSQGIQSKNS